MIKVLYFARVREELGMAGEEIEWQSELSDVKTLIAHLCEDRDQKWHQTLYQPKLLCSVNQSLADMDNPIVEGDEVAFFPPVTGG